MKIERAQGRELGSKKKENNALVGLTVAVLVMVIFSVGVYFVGKPLKDIVGRAYFQYAEGGLLPVTITFDTGETQTSFVHNGVDYVLTVNVVDGILTSADVVPLTAIELVAPLAKPSALPVQCKLDTECAEGEICSNGYCTLQ